MQSNTISEWFSRTYRKPLKLYILPSLATGIILSAFAALPYALLFLPVTEGLHQLLIGTLTIMGLYLIPTTLIGLIFQLLVALPAEEYLQHRQPADIRDHILYGFSMAGLPILWYLFQDTNGATFSQHLMGALPITWFIGPENKYTEILKIVFPLFATQGAIQASLNYCLNRHKSAPNPTNED